MPTSTAKIAANQANSKLSTGPRTPEGKQASSANSTKTGLTCARIFVRPDEREEFLLFTENLIKEFKPRGQFQAHLFDSILHAAWSIRRCMLIECEIQNEAIDLGLPDALADDDLAKRLDRLFRYKKMHESTQRRSIADLRKLQNDQARREQSETGSDSSILIAPPSARRAPQLQPQNEPTADAAPDPDFNLDLLQDPEFLALEAEVMQFGTQLEAAVQALKR